MLSETELLYVLALQRVPNLGDISAKKLIQTVGSAKAIFKEKRTRLLKIPGIGSLKLKHLNERDCLVEAEREMCFIRDHKIECSYFTEAAYPDRLKHCIDGPILLFQTGNIDLKGRKVISIVGTRKVTTYGSSFCRQLVQELAPLNPVIVSGFAYGVDIASQRAAMEHGLQTIGCLAHGLNQVYPKSHNKYVSQVNENGGFLTEFWSDDPFDRNNFLKRNRIIAGISEATIVIESAEKGGSLVTADIATSYHREVFAVPGRAGDAQSQGCNNLIKTQRAHLLTSAADLVYHLGWNLESDPLTPKQTSLFVELTDEEEKIMKFLNEIGSEVLDTIALECATPIHKVASVLLSLELKGLVRPLPGKLFEAL